MEDPKEQKKQVDLSGLSNIDFGPDWKIENKSKTKIYEYAKEKKRKHSYNEIKKENKKEKRVKRGEQQKQDLDIKLEIYPNSEILNKTKSLMAKSGISYSLKEVSNIFCDNIERLNFTLIREKSYFFISNLDMNVFVSEGAAIDHVFNKSLNIEILINKIDIGKPKGNFNFVFLCPKTEILLPPSNFHGFESTIKEHIFHNKIQDTFELYYKKLKRVEDVNQIEQWLNTPLIKYEYRYKDHIKEDKVFYTIESLKLDIKKNSEDRFISKKKKHTIQGSNISLLNIKLKNYILNYFKNNYNWKKELFFQILIILKKSNFYIFKYGKENHLHVVISKPKKTSKVNLSINCTKIIKLLKNKKVISKTEILRNCNSENIEKGTIIKEIGWLVKEGFIREFSNGHLALN